MCENELAFPADIALLTSSADGDCFIATSSLDGEKNLKKRVQANKIDVYPLASKFTGNCGGAGICGTCAVKVIDGMKNFNPASKNEINTINQKKKGASDIRMSCCSRITGPITIKTKP